jgi:hypothetical protein
MVYWRVEATRSALSAALASQSLAAALLLCRECERPPRPGLTSAPAQRGASRPLDGGLLVCGASTRADFELARPLFPAAGVRRRFLRVVMRVFNRQLVDHRGSRGGEVAATAGRRDATSRAGGSAVVPPDGRSLAGCRESGKRPRSRRWPPIIVEVRDGPHEAVPERR